MQAVMQAIVTKFLPCTDSLPARVKATCERGSITLSWNYALDSAPNHRAAIVALLRRFVAEDFEKYGIAPRLSGWACGYHIGGLPGVAGYVAVASRHADIRPEDLDDDDD